MNDLETMMPGKVRGAVGFQFFLPAIKLLKGNLSFLFLEIGKIGFR